jgi:class 3 adenylate cyclase
LLSSAKKREITILFSDIKGFTKATAAMDAGHVRTLLNEYFGRMIEIVFRHDGTLDKFLGDGLMVFFGDPEPQPDHAEDDEDRAGQEAHLPPTEPDRLGKDRHSEPEEDEGDDAARGDHGAPAACVPTITRQSAFRRT